MRLLKIDLPVTYRAREPNLDLNDADMRDWLANEFAAQHDALIETMRIRAAGLLPPTYETFVRIKPGSDPETVRVVFWIDDPTIRWPSGLIARRAWSLSLPILANVVEDAFANAFQQLAISVDQSNAKISALAPTRFWKDPAILIVAVFLLTTLFWFYLGPAAVDTIRGFLR